MIDQRPAPSAQVQLKLLFDWCPHFAPLAKSSYYASLCGHRLVISLCYEVLIVNEFDGTDCWAISDRFCARRIFATSSAMPFTSQFSLSMEVTRLIPLSLVAIGKTYEAAMSLACDLQSSGSDIVVEEDLAMVFGRVSIPPNMATTFRNVMSKPLQTSPLAEGISVYNGPGPTVLRAMTEPPYFATVLQCSFLVHIHERNSLAAAIQQYFDLREQDAPKDVIRRMTASLDSIRGTLQAVEDQTARFEWKHFLHAAAATMKIEQCDIQHDILEAIPTTVFQGLMSMLPLAQRFPEDHLIVVESHSGLCAIVVWAHAILGLSVRVKLFSTGGSCSETLFGSAPEQVIVDTGISVGKPFTTFQPPQSEPAITLLSVTSKEKLFTMKTEPDSDVIDATLRLPAKGYVRRKFEMVAQELQSPEVAVQHLGYISCAFALCMARRTVSHPPDNNETLGTARWTIPEERILEAAALLTDGLGLDREIIGEYSIMYSGVSLASIPRPPTSIATCLKAIQTSRKLFRTSWPGLCSKALRLAALILAFAHVKDLGAASGLPLCARSSLISPAAFYKLSREWNGKAALLLQGDMWFEIIALLMVGHLSSNLDLQRTSLLSNRGWSMYITTFGDADPMYVDPGFICIKIGVPWRKGVWKHKILDGPNQEQGHLVGGSDVTYPGNVTLASSHDVMFAAPFIGEQDDSFIVNLRLKTVERIPGKKEAARVRRSGYNELWSALWIARKATACEHTPCLGDSIPLEPGWRVSSGSADYTSKESAGRILICQTAGSAAARWRALINVLEHRSVRGSQVMLRGSDCCLACVIAQTVVQEGNWFVVL